MKIKKVEWCIAIREKGERTLLDGNTSTPFRVIKNSFRYWMADPFIIRVKGINYLFFEMYDRIKRKGVLGYRVINGDGKVGKAKKIYESVGHLSYPNIFVENNAIYIIPESSADGEVFYLKATEFPEKWEKHTLLRGEKCVDSTFCEFDGNKYMLTTPLVGGDNSRYLSITCVQDILEINRIDDRIAQDDRKTARMAGKIIWNNGSLIRPSQDCGTSYGSALNFSKIQKLSSGIIEECLVRKVYPKDICITNGKIYDGIHTYNANEDYEVIDLKINEKFSLIEIIGYGLEMIKRMIRRLF